METNPPLVEVMGKIKAVCQENQQTGANDGRRAEADMRSGHSKEEAKGHQGRLQVPPVALCTFVSLCSSTVSVNCE